MEVSVEERLHRSARVRCGFAMRAMAVEFPEVDGHPNRLHILEKRVDMHEKSVQRVKGLAAAFGGLLTIVHLAIAWVSGKHN